MIYILIMLSLNRSTFGNKTNNQKQHIFSPHKINPKNIIISKYFKVISQNKKKLSPCQSSMNFILNPNPLPFHSHPKRTQGLQYYQWRYKQKQLEEEQKTKNLKIFLEDIEKQENCQNRNNGNNVNKKRMHHDGTFYEYSMQWKKKVEEKVQEEKICREIEIQKREDKAMKKEVREDKRDIQCQHKGPIEGWYFHFQNYLKRKSYNQTVVQEELTFQPKINQRSRKITQGMVGKVQDRLIKFGQFLKQRTQDQLNKQNMDAMMNYSFNNSGSNQNQKYSSNQSDIFYRLYKQSQQTNRKRKQAMNNDQVHTFHPKINILPEQFEERIVKRRKPLYYIKNQIKQEKDEDKGHEKEENGESTQKGKKNKGDFQAFMKRNQALLDAKRKMMMAFREQVDQKQNLQKSQCTFTPVLNTNSKKIRQKSLLKNKKFQQQLLSNIKTSSPQPQPSPRCGSARNEDSSLNLNNQGLENIDISKLTIPQNKEIDESDSLSIYRTSRLNEQPNFDNKSTTRSMKKQNQYETGGNLGQAESVKIKSQRKSMHPKNNEKEQSLKIKIREQEEVQENYQESEEAQCGNVAEDSIDKMKTTQWESQFEQIETHLQNMIKRTQR